MQKKRIATHFVSCFLYYLCSTKHYKMQKTKDAMGSAIADYWKNGVAGRLRVFSPDFDEDEIPVETLFRELDEMPALEQKALRMAEGRVLDVGAGSGCHSLELQDMGREVVAIDISPLSVEVMKDRGIADAREQDFWQMECAEGEKFDTILMLMNGIGIVGTVDLLPQFFAKIGSLLAEGGCVLLDSTDIRYLFEEEDGSFAIDLNAGYYGELVYQMQYKRTKGEPFPWLYIDFATLQGYAEENGFVAELVEEGEHYDYLARLTQSKF